MCIKGVNDFFTIYSMIYKDYFKNRNETILKEINFITKFIDRMQSYNHNDNLIILMRSMFFNTLCQKAMEDIPWHSCVDKVLFLKYFCKTIRVGNI